MFFVHIARNLHYDKLQYIFLRSRDSLQKPIKPEIKQELTLRSILARADESFDFSRNTAYDPFVYRIRDSQKTNVFVGYYLQPTYYNIMENFRNTKLKTYTISEQAKKKTEAILHNKPLQQTYIEEYIDPLKF